MGHRPLDDFSVFGDLKTCVIFEVPEVGWPRLEPGKKYDIFRDPSGIEILNRIRFGLVHQGYNMTIVKPGVGIEAGVMCKVDKLCEIAVILGVSRRSEGRITCDIMTYYSPSLLRRMTGRSIPGPNCAAQMQLLCRAIDNELTSLGATSSIWLTHSEANSWWRGLPGGLPELR